MQLVAMAETLKEYLSQLREEDGVSARSVYQGDKQRQVQTGVQSEEGARIRRERSNAHNGRDACQGARIRSGSVMPSREDEDVDTRQRHEVSNQLWV